MNDLKVVINYRQNVFSVSDIRYQIDWLFRHNIPVPGCLYEEEAEARRQMHRFNELTIKSLDGLKLAIILNRFVFGLSDAENVSLLKTRYNLNISKATVIRTISEYLVFISNCRNTKSMSPAASNPIHYRRNQCRART